MTRELKQKRPSAPVTDAASVGGRDTPISLIMLTARAWRALLCLNVRTVSHLEYIDEYDLIRLPNCGRKTVNEIIATGRQYGVELGAKVSPRS